MSALRAGAIAALPALRARHPQHFAAITPGRMRAAWMVAAALAVVALGIWRMEIDPARLLSGFGRLLHFVSLMLPPDPGTYSRTMLILHGVAETLAIALLGTLFAALLALPFALLAARNTTPHAVPRFAARRGLDIVRGIDALIWALIWISIVGLGPFAGVLAIMTSDIGTLGKMFADAIETADRKAEEGIAAAGGAHAHRVRFGIIPQVLPVLAGQVLYIFESNVRSSAIIGIVGAGGIGLFLGEMIRMLEWPVVSFIVLLILLLVTGIDAISSRLRRMIAGNTGAGNARAGNAGASNTGAGNTREVS